MKPKDLVGFLCKEMRSVGVDNPDLEARWIAEEVLQKNFVEILTSSTEVEMPTVISRAEEIVAQRKKGVPLAYLFGEKEFYGHKFFVSTATLIPRPETEGIVTWALEQIERRLAKKQELTVLDLGAGTGCIGLSVLLNNPNAKLVAVEASVPAYEILKKNCKAHGLCSRTEMLLMKAEEALPLWRDKVDIVLANPPYISTQDKNVDESVHKYEPHEALYSGESGLQHIRSWLMNLSCDHSVVSAVGFEIGATQGEEVVSLFEETGLFQSVYVLKDLNGLDRIVCGERR